MAHFNSHVNVLHFKTSATSTSDTPSRGRHWTHVRTTALRAPCISGASTAARTKSGSWTGSSSEAGMRSWDGGRGGGERSRQAGDRGQDFQ